jgi:hypothetical protein
MPEAERCGDEDEEERGGARAKLEESPTPHGLG